MTGLLSDLRRALDPAAMADSIGITLDKWQRDALQSFSPRILLNCARQSGKSEITAMLSVHTALYDPGSTVLLLSPSMRQSGELFRRSLAIYRGLGRPVVATSENALSLVLENGSRIISLPGTEATVRGYSRVALLCVDEASRVADDIVGAIRPMLAISSGRIVALSTPNGRRGWWYEAWAHGGDAWLRFEVPASANPRIDPAFLKSERAALGPLLYAQEYENSFLAGSATAAFDAEAVAAAFRRDPNFQPLQGGFTPPEDMHS